MILTHNFLEDIAYGKQYVRINGTNSALPIVHNGSLKEAF